MIGNKPGIYNGNSIYNIGWRSLGHVTEFEKSEEYLDSYTGTLSSATRTNYNGKNCNSVTNSFYLDLTSNFDVDRVRKFEISFDVNLSQTYSSSPHAGNIAIDSVGSIFRTTHFVGLDQSYLQAYARGATIKQNFCKNGATPKDYSNFWYNITTKMISSGWHTYKIIFNGEGMEVYIDDTLYYKDDLIFHVLTNFIYTNEMSNPVIYLANLYYHVWVED